MGRSDARQQKLQFGAKQSTRVPPESMENAAPQGEQLEMSEMKALLLSMHCLELQLKRLELERAEAPSADVARRLCETLTEFQETAEHEVLFRGKYARSRSYGEGERSGRSLAHTLRAARPENTIRKISDASGRLLRDTPEMLETFADYYQHLYSSTGTEPPDVNGYLMEVALAWLSDAQQDFLAAELEHDEIREAMMQLQSGKAPEPDGIPDEFYRYTP
ncbi:hypothetical protein NDU88_003834 [Pleurodeles waltl]|uniref:Uncharacterized protein n=1 Tax=Pleurodeles waltl TaxID=8319 RepID=A0AAV7MRV5_PLEWA|nr:hypothetical protein NDU88_003834 [Pleurodeles waltl]